MTAHIHCLHTSERDVAVYEALFAKTGAALRLTHDVRPELLGADQRAWAFFVPFIMVTTFAVVNLLVGLIVNSM